jgi:hypothetical protein
MVILLISEDEKTELAKNCNDCLGWLSVCDGECCKSFGFNFPQKFDIKKYEVKISFKYDPFMIQYYNLHNCKYDMRNKVLIIRLQPKMYCWVGNTLQIFNRCEWLDTNNECLGHPNNKPFCCKDLNLETYNSGKYFKTPNCLFKYKKVVVDDRIFG